MASGSFYRRGTSLTSGLSNDDQFAYGVGVGMGSASNGISRSSSSMGNMYEFPSASAGSQQDVYSQEGMNQKLDRVVSLMLEQREISNTIQKETNELREEVASLTTELTLVKQKVEATKDSSSGSRARKKIPSQLSGAIKQLHEKYDEACQFNGSKEYQDESNVKVKDSLLMQLTEEFADVYSPARVKRAVHRYYESRRRLFNDSRPSRVDKVQESRRNSKKQALRKQLYDRRKKHLKEKEKEKWSLLDFNYMTEESDHSDCVVQHSLPWRSEGLNKRIKKIEARRRASDSKRGGFKSKVRVPGLPSNLLPPPGAPKWAVNSIPPSPASSTSPNSQALGAATSISTTPTVITQRTATPRTTPTVRRTTPSARVSTPSDAQGSMSRISPSVAAHSTPRSSRTSIPRTLVQPLDSSSEEETSSDDY